MVQLPDPLVGKTAPAFCLPDAQGTQVCLEQFRNRWIVLYFYPRDNTPVCTLEAMQFNAALGRFAGLGAQVIGVSTDSEESHQKFAGQHNLNILLLSDTEHKVLAAYDSWKPMTMFGKDFFGTQRDTFLIDPSGIILVVWRKVSVKGHADEVEKELLERQKERGT